MLCTFSRGMSQEDNFCGIVIQIQIWYIFRRKLIMVNLHVPALHARKKRYVKPGAGGR